MTFNIPEGVNEYLNHFLPAALSFIVQVIIAIIVLLIGGKIIKWIVKILKKSLEKSRIEAGVAGFLASLVKWALYFVLIMIILSAFGVTTGSVIAVLGSAGLTLGLSLQGSLANFAGGVLILLLKPFTVGDYIQEKSSNLEGTVKNITIFYTMLTTVDNKEISIPNGNLSNSSIVNVTKNPTRRVDVNVSVAYQSDLKKVKEVLYSVAVSNDKVLKDQPIDVFVADLEDSCVKMELRVWAATSEYWNVKWNLTESVKTAMDSNNIEIPFPQLDVSIKKTT